MSALFEDDPSEEGEWISISDLMAGLMVIFLFIAIVYIRDQVIEKERAIEKSEELERVQAQIREVAFAWERSYDAIYDKLLATFRYDLDDWNATIDAQSLTIRFDAPDVLFASDETVLRPRFEAIIADFFPRYIGVLRSFDEDIEEVRIEGHTSSIWGDAVSLEDAFVKNMDLSQGRTRAVLEYALGLDALTPDRAWVMEKVTANGMSSSRLRFDAFDREDAEASRRVEFTVRTKTEKRIMSILEKVQ